MLVLQILRQKKKRRATKIERNMMKWNSKKRTENITCFTKDRNSLCTSETNHFRRPREDLSAQGCQNGRWKRLYMKIYREESSNSRTTCHINVENAGKSLMVILFCPTLIRNIWILSHWLTHKLLSLLPFASLV